MGRQIQALFTCNDVLERKANDGSVEGQIVKFHASYTPDPNHPNYEFWKATPTGTLEMTINNPAAFGAFRRGQNVLLTFEAIEDSAARV